MPTGTVPLNSSRSSLALHPLAYPCLDEGPSMIDRPPAPPTAIPNSGLASMESDGSGDADSDFCATLLAMAAHDLRQPL
jgi:hypothetical protein